MACEDITDRVRDQRALAENEAKYRSLYEESKRREELYQSLLNSSVDAVIIYDMVGQARYVNPSFTAKFGWTMDEVLGQKIPFVPESEIECTVKRISDLVEKGIPCSDFETRRYTKEGRILQVSIDASRYLDHEGTTGRNARHNHGHYRNVRKPKMLADRVKLDIETSFNIPRMALF